VSGGRVIERLQQIPGGGVEEMSLADTRTIGVVLKLSDQDVIAVDGYGNSKLVAARWSRIIKSLQQNAGGCVEQMRLANIVSVGVVPSRSDQDVIALYRHCNAKQIFTGDGWVVKRPQ